MGKRKHAPYRSVRERFESGELELVDPFDYLILDRLPEVGTLLGGYYPITASVSELQSRHFPEVTQGIVFGRVRSMSDLGLVTMPMVSGRGKGGWQRTKAGSEVLKKWKQDQQLSKES